MRTTRTRIAGLTALIAPVLLAVGQLGNVTIDRGAGHGLAVVMLTLAFPAFAVGLWGLRARHGGLGRLGRAAFVLVVASPILSMPAGWGWLQAFIFVLSVPVVVFSVELLRAAVLPVAPLTVFAAGALGIGVLMVGAAVATVTGHDAGAMPPALFFAPVAVLTAGYGWLGWHLWREPAADAPSTYGPTVATG